MKNPSIRSRARPAEITLHEEGSIERVYGRIKGLGWVGIKAAQAEDEVPKKFFRIARLVPPRASFIKLEALLGRVDAELELAAEHAQAQVVGHSWGLYPSKGSIPKAPAPMDHILLAEVDTIVAAAETPPEVTHATKIGVANYTKNRRSKRHGLGDVRLDQWMYGVNLNQTHSSNENFLVDIDPIFLKTPLAGHHFGKIILPRNKPSDVAV